MQMQSLILAAALIPAILRADVYTAASCLYADVSAAADSANEGDTVRVPAGTAMWAHPLNITKGIIFKGAGIGKTVIVNGITPPPWYQNPLIYYNPSNYNLDTPFRLTGFSFDLNNNGGCLYLGETSKMAPFTAQTKVRIDHNRFFNAPSLLFQAITNKGTLNGVVDNNIFDGVWYPTRNDPGLSLAAGRSWYRYLYPLWNVGNGYALFYEDNNFLDIRDGENNDGILTDGQYGARYVFRYNTISLYKASQNLFDLHGYDANGEMYGCFGAEIYGNLITAPGGTITLFADRSGKSMIFGNAGMTSGVYDAHLYNNASGSCPTDYVSEQIIHDTYYWANRKNLTTPIDAIHTGAPMTCNGLANVPLLNRDYYTDIGATPYIRCGTLSTMPATCSVGQAYWATDQSSTDLTGMVGANPAETISGTLYRCTTPNVWTAYYTPYTYPHPLRTTGPLSDDTSSSASLAPAWLSMDATQATIRLIGARVVVSLPASVRAPELTILNLTGRVVSRLPLGEASRTGESGRGSLYNCAWRAPPGAGTYIAVVKETLCVGIATASAMRFIIIR
jgi:hypothetical protein